MDYIDIVDQLREASGLNNPDEYNAEDALILKDLAALGDVCAAIDLNVGYDCGQFNDDLEPEPQESFRWALVENYLRGYIDWIESTQVDAAVTNSEQKIIITEVRKWIDSHPIARQTAARQWFRMQHESTGRNTPLSDGHPDMYYKRGDL